MRFAGAREGEDATRGPSLILPRNRPRVFSPRHLNERKTSGGEAKEREKETENQTEGEEERQKSGSKVASRCGCFYLESSDRIFASPFNTYILI